MMWSVVLSTKGGVCGERFVFVVDNRQDGDSDRSLTRRRIYLTRDSNWRLSTRCESRSSPRDAVHSSAARYTRDLSEMEGGFSGQLADRVEVTGLNRLLRQRLFHPDEPTTVVTPRAHMRSGLAGKRALTPPLALCKPKCSRSTFPPYAINQPIGCFTTIQIR